MKKLIKILGGMLAAVLLLGLFAGAALAAGPHNGDRDGDGCGWQQQAVPGQEPAGHTQRSGLLPPWWYSELCVAAISQLNAKRF